MFDTYSSVEVFGKFARDLFNQPVLNRSGLYGQPYQYDQGDQYQQHGPGYFPKLSQGWSLLNVKIIKPFSKWRKINTNELFLSNFSAPLTYLETCIASIAVLYIRKMVGKVGYFTGF
ncbi:hypothetical protein A4H97_25885 [Niastella yeongjuensis]|uniref:Uncharacterized protein n=1 Tax=Niastella yeongjuensis TaxID=354355 RepID=A0A1V9F151_9BACT|nr:hypothetical protein A4H97_25885 [Niastella yeongjuensis]